jgi:hypothetical protein
LTLAYNDLQRDSRLCHLVKPPDYGAKVFNMPVCFFINENGENPFIHGDIELAMHAAFVKISKEKQNTGNLF